MVYMCDETNHWFFWCTAARLQLFGSSKNGFGFKQSDLDICMVLEGQESINVCYLLFIVKINLYYQFVIIDDFTGRGLHLSNRKPGKTAEETLRWANALFVEISKTPRNIWTHIHACTGVKNVLPITTAKVPIVKFYHVQTGLEGDISLYNTLVELFHRLFCDFCHFSVFALDFVFLLNTTLSFQALHNTHLLASYAAIDRRVKILCYIMKVFAKVSMFCTHMNWNIHIRFFRCSVYFPILFPHRCVTLGMRHAAAFRPTRTPSWRSFFSSNGTLQWFLCFKRYGSTTVYSRVKYTTWLYIEQWTCHRFIPPSSAGSIHREGRVRRQEKWLFELIAQQTSKEDWYKWERLCSYEVLIFICRFMMDRRNPRCWLTAGTCISLTIWKHSWAFCTFI